MTAALTDNLTETLWEVLNENHLDLSEATPEFFMLRNFWDTFFFFFFALIL